MIRILIEIAKMLNTNKLDILDANSVIAVIKYERC